MNVLANDRKAVIPHRYIYVEVCTQYMENECVFENQNSLQTRGRNHTTYIQWVIAVCMNTHAIGNTTNTVKSCKSSIIMAFHFAVGVDKLRKIN